MRKVKFTDELIENATEIMDQIMDCEYVEGIKVGEVPKSALIRYVQQDEMYLNGYADQFQQIKKETIDLKLQKFLVICVNGIRDEHTPHDVMMRFIDIAGKQVQGVPMLSVTKNYVKSMHNAVNTKSILIGLSALAPCIWTYYVIAYQLNKSDCRNNPFNEWIKFYLDPSEMKSIFYFINQLAEIHPDERGQANMVFQSSCQYELDFWNTMYEA
ncbi:TenA family protein [Fructilactobacillus fructivorans]|uniref:Aminopyrimidine aminohydrolase n=1 Tax=Fructilactobacillus fructivorans TaxID=1614 RepID=A0AAE6P0U8_9LACO|nr:TenA family protein [Fructilactobacillus fructivorans]QFX92332.1 hypothetical protein LF543_01525 [Fructilactobacillus fructivorans]RDV64884.1 hypothetical protein DXU76_05270 [Fructilactobacillus fructivorans]